MTLARPSSSLDDFLTALHQLDDASCAAIDLMAQGAAFIFLKRQSSSQVVQLL
jgi:hypothetical protein